MFQLVSILRAVRIDGVFALSRYRDLDAQPGGFRGGDHGRAHSQPDARARPRASFPDRGRSPSWSRSCCRSWKRWWPSADAVREGIGRTVVRNLKMMARMGVLLEDASAAAVSGISAAFGGAVAGKTICRRSAAICCSLRNVTTLRPLSSRPTTDQPMPNFLESIFAQLQARATTAWCCAKFARTSLSPSRGRELLAQMQRARSYVAKIRVARRETAALCWGRTPFPGWRWTWR